VRLRFGVRRNWNNYIRTQGVDPLRVYHPANVQQIVEVVQEAEREGVTARAVGSGHSWSDATLTRGFLIEMTKVSGFLEIGQESLADNVDTTHLVKVKGGTKLAVLNEGLRERGLGLTNMSGYDGLSIAGLMSTSTHGSGIAFGPIHDFVRSIELVASGGRRFRIEPFGGISDPERFGDHHPEMKLIQDDDYFHAVLVGMGCLGVITAVVIEVEPFYYLKEVRTIRPWSEVRQDLLDGEVLRRNRHYELLFNPYARNGDHSVVVTERNVTVLEEGESPDRLRRNLIPELIAKFPLTPLIINFIVGVLPKVTPWLIDRVLNGLKDKEYTNVSYKVLNIGPANTLPAFSTEMAVPVDDAGTHVKAVEKVMEIAEHRRRLGGIYQSSPTALRFVKESPALMSMMHERLTMTMELIQVTHTEGGNELLAAYEEAVHQLGGRPHWGQLNTLNAHRETLDKLYPRYCDWLKVHAELNASGVFNSPFSKRVGISSTSA
jgi:L-gulono-1,4-lactone dehydrogenase